MPPVNTESSSSPSPLGRGGELESRGGLFAARSYLAAGFSVIPIRADGSKAPAVSHWKAFQKTRPTEAQLDQWFGDDTPQGIGLIHGAVSGHSEALDFDQPGLYDQFTALCHQQGFGALVDRLPLVLTPSGGHHLLSRCADLVAGNTKLAETPDRKTLIETRGEGGYTLAPGSAPACHSAGTAYQFLRGGPDTLPCLTPEERATLWTFARLFNAYADPRRVVDAPQPTPGDGLRPGDDYAARGDYEALLEQHGWERLGETGGKTLWRRPGKHGPGISATGNYADCGLFYVFSSNAAPFQPQTAYHPFAVYALLDHGGDFHAAARALADAGFGAPSRPPLSDFRYALPMTPEPFPSPASPAAPVPRRKPLADRIIDLADVGPPGDLPLLFGKYLLQGHAHWLTGQTGLGKSTLLFNIACALAEGTPLWGIPCEPTKVLYADMESGDVGRAFKIERLYQDAPRVRGQLFFLREAIKLPEELDDLLAYVRTVGIELVIFDTARRCFSVRDENDNAEVYNRVIPTLDALKQLGVASLTLGHPSKNGNGSARGAGAQEDAGDVNLSLTMHRGEVTDPDGVISLRVTKNRLLGLDIAPLLLQRLGSDHFEPVSASDLAAEEKALTSQARCDAAILDYLTERNGEPARHKAIVARLVAEGLPEGTVKGRISVLQKAHRISHDLTGGYVLGDGGSSA